MNSRRPGCTSLTPRYSDTWWLAFFFNSTYGTFYHSDTGISMLFCNVITKGKKGKIVQFEDRYLRNKAPSRSLAPARVWALAKLPTSAAQSLTLMMRGSTMRAARDVWRNSDSSHTPVYITTWHKPQSSLQSAFFGNHVASWSRL